jgi:dihydroorotase
MMNRRQFLSATAASGAMLACAPSAFAQMTFDLIIKGGRVIDPSIGLDAVRDVAIATRAARSSRPA